MALTCQTVVTRATAFSTLNTALASDRSEMLSRIRADQQALFDGFLSEIGDRFHTTTTVTSTAGSSGRTADLSALTPPLGRLLSLSITATGARLRQVDVQDQDAKHPPRYYMRSRTAVEVSDDWGATGTVGLTVAYVQGPTDIDPTGAYTQEISVPDAWADLLVLPLAMYLHLKDPGRDTAEYEKLAAQLAERRAAFQKYLHAFGGDALHPTPNEGPR